jgi:thymidylate synthase
MHVIKARNVAEALPLGIEYLKKNGTLEESRAGMVLVSPLPVTTVYEKPTERVLFSATRNANPFFHLMESLWMLAGRQDAHFLNTFIHDFGKRFAESDGSIHDAYGHRWRRHFEMDQLEEIIWILKQDPGSRQAVLQMWDPEVDLGTHILKTRPCNTCAYFRVNNEKLEMMVSCRSNDIIFGCYGANAVHFSILQEYIAAAVGFPVGRYYQVSYNYHAYVDVFEKYENADLHDNRYPMETQPLVDDVNTFIQEVEAVIQGFMPVYKNRFLSGTVWPMLQTFRAGKPWGPPIAAPDWRAASEEWVARRKQK